VSNLFFVKEVWLLQTNKHLIENVVKIFVEVVRFVAELLALIE
jgi:hypothetical protein